MNALSFFILVLSVSCLVQAKETDNLTGRYKSLEDSTEILDAEMNKRLQALAEKASSKEIPCNQAIEIRRLFNKQNQSSFLIGSMESFAEDNDRVAKRKASPKNSIYEGVLAKGLIFNNVDLASTVKVNGQLVGTDKFGHFIDQGFRYYTDYRERKYDMKETLRSSTSSETSYNGSNSTGIASYADAMANYKGILFFHALTEGANPYLRCVEGQWTQVNKFSWAEYVDEGWDEGINCVSIKSDTSKAAYEANIKKLEAQAKANGKDQNYHCPVDIDACSRLKARYSPHDEFLLGSECRKAAKAGRPASSTGAPAQR
jgi:hypothetical protein